MDPATGNTVYFDPTTNTVKKEPTTITIDTKKELETRILERYNTHFTQTKNTPQHTSPLNKINSKKNFNLYKANEMDILMPDRTFIETQTILGQKGFQLVGYSLPQIGG